MHRSKLSIWKRNRYSYIAEVLHVLATEINLLLITTTGRVWLNYLDCSAGDEVIEDCSHRGWGLSYCSHFDDVGVICRPNGT